MKLPITLLSVLFATTAFGSAKFPPPYDKNMDAGLPSMTQGDSDKLEAQARERSKRRVIASVDIAGEDLLSKEYKAFRKTFLAIKSSSEIDGLLKNLDAHYATSPDDLKFAAVQLVPLLAFRSIVYRMVPLAEQAKVTQSMLLTMVKQMSSGMHVYLPTDQWAAGFAYVTEPSDLAQTRFKSEADLQLALASEVLPQLTNSAKRLRELNFSRASVVTDSQLMYGTASFSDNMNRYRQVGEAERYGEIANIHLGISWISMFCAYNLDHMFELSQDLGRLYGVDGFEFWKGVEGAPASRRAEILSDPKYASFLTLSKYGTDWTQTSLKHLKQAVLYSNVVWMETKGRPASESSALDPAFINPAGKQIDLTLPSVKAMIAGKAQITSAITGEKMDIDLPAFYNNPPQDLKALLPNHFDESPLLNSKSLKTADGSTQTVQYHNYLSGRATGWNVAAYQKFFPDVKSSADIARSAKILSQTWGGGISGITLAFIGL